MGYTCLRGFKMTASRSNAAPVVLANRRGKNGFRRHGGSLAALLLGSAVLFSPMAAHAQLIDINGGLLSTGTGPGVSYTNTGAPGVLTFDIPFLSSFVMNGAISNGTGISVVKDGLGRQDLNAHSTYAGGTTLNAGILGFGFGDSLGTGTITLNGGELAATGGGAVVNNSIHVTAETRILSNNTTLAGTITGTAVIDKYTSSLLTITGNNSGFDGGFNAGNIVTGFGTIFVGSTNSLGSSSAVFTSTSAGRLTNAAGVTNSVLANDFVLGGTLTILEATTDSMTFNGDISGASGINLGTTTSGHIGTVNFNGNNAGFTGTLSVIDTAVIGVGSNTALGTQAVVVQEDVTILALSNGLSIANGMTVGNSTPGDRVLTVDTNGNDLTMTGAINNRTPATARGSLLKIGGGTLFLTSTAGNYSLGTQINGGAISVSTGAALGLGGTALGFDGGTLQITGTTFTSTNRPITLNAGGGGFDIANAANTLNLGAVIVGTGGLNKLGAGTLTLNAANTFAGNSTVSAGTLNLANSQGFGPTGSVTLAGGEIKAGNPGLDMANDLVLSGGGIDTNGEDFTISGVVSGGSDLTVHGFGILALANSANSYTGDTLVTDGALQADANDVFGNGGDVVLSDGTSLIAGGASVSFSNDVYIAPTTIIDTGANTMTLDGVVHDNGGAGTISKSGSGTLVLTNGANDFSGGTSINAGTINIDSQTALSTGAIVMQDGTSFGGASASNFDIANNITINGTSTVGANATRFQLDGIIDGSGTLAMSYAGYLVLRGNNTYTGGTDITSG